MEAKIKTVGYLKRYEVAVGNVGTVHRGHDAKKAAELYDEWVEESKTGVGRASGEPVYLFDSGVLVQEYWPPEYENEPADERVDSAYADELEWLRRDCPRLYVDILLCADSDTAAGGDAGPAIRNAVRAAHPGVESLDDLRAHVARVYDEAGLEPRERSKPASVPAQEPKPLPEREFTMFEIVNPDGVGLWSVDLFSEFGGALDLFTSGGDADDVRVRFAELNPGWYVSSFQYHIEACDEWPFASFMPSRWDDHAAACFLADAGFTMVALPDWLDPCHEYGPNPARAGSPYCADGSVPWRVYECRRVVRGVDTDGAGEST